MQGGLSKGGLRSGRHRQRGRHGQRRQHRHRNGDGARCGADVVEHARCGSEMRLQTRLLLAIGFLLATAALVLRMEMAQADLWRCINNSTYRDDVWYVAERALMRPSKDTLAIAIAVLPTILAIALARRLWLQTIAFAPMAILSMLLLLSGAMHHFDLGAMHDCDRKGCTGCFGIFVWVVFIQFPIGTLLLMGLGLQRLCPLQRQGRRGWSADRARGPR